MTLLRVSAVAKALDCSETNVYALISSGQLKSHPVGAGGKGHRITQAELDRFLREGPTVKPKQRKVSKTRKLKVFDAETMLAAWRRRDAAAGLPNERSIPSVSSECDQVAAQGSSSQPR